MDKKELLLKLKNDIENLEKTIDNYEFYNFKASLLKGLIKTGIGSSHILPLIQSGLTIYYIFNLCSHDPFLYDEREVFKKIDTTTTSTGIEIENSTYDNVPLNNNLFYTTSWNLNDNNLYERIVTEYNIKSNSKYVDSDEILNFSKEELDSLYEISNIITYQKNELNEEEKIYNENMVVYQETVVSTTDVKKVKQSQFGDLIDTFVFALFTAIGKVALDNIVYKKIIKKLKNADLKINYISTNSLHEMTKALEIKKQNYEFLLKK